MSIQWHEFKFDGRERRIPTLDDYLRRGNMKHRQESRVVPGKMKEPLTQAEYEEVRRQLTVALDRREKLWRATKGETERTLVTYKRMGGTDPESAEKAYRAYEDQVEQDYLEVVRQIAELDASVIC